MLVTPEPGTPVGWSKPLNRPAIAESPAMPGIGMVARRPVCVKGMAKLKRRERE